MIIDAHVYCLSPRLRDQRVNLGPENAAIAKAIHHHKDGERVLPLSAPESILESMKDSGIDQSILVSFPFATHDLCVENNDFLFETLKKYPGRFYAICSVQPKDPRSIDEAKRCLKAGAVGIKINGGWQGFELESSSIQSLLRLLEAENKFLLTHIDQAFRKSPTSAAHLFQIASENPKTKIMAAHMGGLLGIYNSFEATAKNLKNIWFDTAVSETLEMVDYYVRAGLSDKIIFGSDYPFNHCHSQKLVKERIQQLHFDKSVEENIFSKNLSQLMKISKGSDLKS